MGAVLNPDIVTDGLVLCLDAGLPKSYPGDGSIWYDVSGNNRDATLVGSIEYSNQNQGSFLFNGTNTRAEITNLGLSYSDFSIESVIKPLSNDGLYNAIISTTLGTNNDYSHGLNWDLGTSSSVSFDVMNLEISRSFGGFYNRDVMLSSFSFGVWVHVLLVVDSVNDNYIIYVNGSQDYTNTYSGTITNFDRISIGQRYYSGGYQGSSTFNGNIGFIKIYNRPLSPSEVSKNYKALKGRYD
jgi:hypothetical protein